MVVHFLRWFTVIYGCINSIPRDTTVFSWVPASHHTFFKSPSFRYVSLALALVPLATIRLTVRTERRRRKCLWTSPRHPSPRQQPLRPAAARRASGGRRSPGRWCVDFIYYCRKTRRKPPAKTIDSLLVPVLRVMARVCRHACILPTLTPLFRPRLPPPQTKTGTYLQRPVDPGASADPSDRSSVRLQGEVLAG